MLTLFEKNKNISVFCTFKFQQVSSEGIAVGMTSEQQH